MSFNYQKYVEMKWFKWSLPFKIVFGTVTQHRTYKQIQLCMHYLDSDK